MGITVEEAIEREKCAVERMAAISDMDLDEYMVGPDWDWVTTKMVEGNEGLDAEQIRTADLAVRRVMLDPETPGGTRSVMAERSMLENPDLDERAVWLAVDRFRWQIEMAYAGYEDVREFLTDFPTLSERRALVSEMLFGTDDPKELFGGRRGFCE